MQKLKSVLSRGNNGKEGEAQAEAAQAQESHDAPTTTDPTPGKLAGEGTHFPAAEKTQPAQESSGDYHPIYDEFTNGKTAGATSGTEESATHETAGEPITDTVPHVSTTSDAPQTTDESTKHETAGEPVTDTVPHVSTTSDVPQTTSGIDESTKDKTAEQPVTDTVPHVSTTSETPQTASGKDQLTEGATAGESIETTDHAQPASNTTKPPQTTSANVDDSIAPAATSSLNSDTAQRPTTQDDMSTASIKSGVIGFPQGGPHDSHPALSRNRPEPSQENQTQAATSDNLSSAQPGHEESHVGEGAAVGAGLAGAGALATHESQTNPEEEKNFDSRGEAQQAEVQESNREFPLAGGVTGEKPSHTTTHEREPGTKEKEAGVHDGQGSEALTGATAAAVPATVPQSEQHVADSQSHPAQPTHAEVPAAALSTAPMSEQHETVSQSHPDQTADPATLAAATATAAAASSSTPHREQHETVSQSQPTQTTDPATLAAATATGAAASSAAPHSEQREVAPQSKPTQTAHPEALAAATAAAANAPASAGFSHDHDGHGHTFQGDPCGPENQQSTGDNLLFTSGPHSTDTANRVDPKLHVPGEFPSPTPLEESNTSSYVQSKPTAETNPSAFAAEPELRHTGSLDEPQSKSTEQPASSHYHREAAIVGGTGLAGAAAYEAEKHHQKESTDVGEETIPSEPSPHSRNTVDSRVDTAPRGDIADQRYDPTVSEKPSEPNAALLAGGATEAPVPAAEPAPQEPVLENKEYPAATQDVKTDTEHHYGRDAALVGAGAATTAGLYASQREAEPSSGPASATIGPHESNIANVLDPRVLPDPNLQKHHHAAPTVEDPAPSTVGPHKSDIANIVDPRVLPDPQKQKAAPPVEKDASTVPTQAQPQALEEPSKEEHHHGRDAAFAGDAGAAGLGAYEAAKSYGEHPSTQPSASMTEQRYDPTAPGAHDPTSATKHYISAPRAQDDVTTQTPAAESQHHHARDAAAVGGTGALGAGAYAATHGHDQTQQPPVAQEPIVSQEPTATQAPVVSQEPAAAQAPTHTEPSHHRYDSAQDPQAKSEHSKLPAALVAGTAAGAGASAYSAHDAQKEHERQLNEQAAAFDAQQAALEKQHAEDQKQHDKLVAAEEKKHHKEAEREEKEHAKEVKKEQKEQEKEAKKEQKEHEKEVKKQEKEHEKEVKKEQKEHEKEQKEHEKELKKQQKEHDKLVAAEEKRASKEEERTAEEDEEGEHKEKKHRFLTFLNKKDKDTDKDKTPEHSAHEAESETVAEASELQHAPAKEAELAPAGPASEGPAASPAAAASSTDEPEGKLLGEKNGRNVLHKDPPKGHPAREAMEAAAAKKEHVGTDGEIGSADQVSGDRTTAPGVYGAHPAEDVLQRDTTTGTTAAEPHA